MFKNKFLSNVLRFAVLVLTIVLCGVVAQVQVPTAQAATNYTEVTKACNGSHSGWTALTQSKMDSYLNNTSSYKAAYYLPAGKYYLSDNINVSSYNISVEGDTQFTLCLNGKYLKMNNSNMFEKEYNSSGSACDIHICDCKPSATIKGYIDSNGVWQLGTSVPSGATACNLSGGALIGSKTIIKQRNQKCIITGGNIVGANLSTYGVIELDGSEHHLRDCKIIGNKSDSAIVYASNAQLNIYGNVVFEKNTCTSTRYASIHGASGTVNIANGKFQNNRFAYGVIGTSGATVNITGGTFTGNVADQASDYNRYAGAFYMDGGTLNVSDITISNNTGKYGMIYTRNGTLNVNNVTISGNTGARSGGIYATSSTNATLTDVTVTNNTTTETGGNYGAVYLGASKDVNIGGKIVINGNIGNNLFSYNTSLHVLEENPLTTDSKIGFKFYEGNATKPVTMITALKNAQENDNHIINEMDTTIYKQLQDGGDVIIYKELTLSYDANGASGTAPDSVVGIGSNITVAENTFTAPYINYGFAGWATTADGEVAYVSGDKVTIAADTTLYPVWEALNEKFVVELGEALFYSGEEQTQDINVFFDGNELEEGIDYDVADNTATELGTYTLTITLKGDYYGTVTKDFTVSKVLLAKPIADDTSFVYTGSAQTYQVTENDFYTITDNVKTNAGEYVVTVSLNDKVHYAWADNSTQDITYTFVIAKANYNMSGITMSDKTVTYNGEAHSIAIEGTLPDGVSVSYENNNQTNVGEYTITANFVGSSNYNDIAPMSATLTIKKAVYDMSEVVFEDKAVVYTGNAFSIEATNLPTGVSVEYQNNGKTEIGEYTIIAKFTGDVENYELIDNMTATLTIKKATFTFDTNTEDDIAEEIIINSSNGVDSNKELVVKLVESEKTDKDYKEFIDKNQKVAVAYDVKLLEDGVSVQPDGTLQFKILIPTKLVGKDFTILHIHNGNEASDIEYQIEGDYVVFESDTLSEFVFVYESNFWFWFIIILIAVILLAGILVVVL